MTGFSLTTLAAIKLYLGIPTLTTTYDALLTALNLSAEQRIAQLCNREDNGFLTGSVTQYLNGYGSPSVVLQYTPITAVASVDIVVGNANAVSVATTGLSMDGIAIASLSASVVGTIGELRFYGAGQSDLRYRFDSGLPLREDAFLPSYGACFPNRPRAVKVVYTGGYANQAGVPYDLAQCALELTCYLFAKRRRDQGLKSERLDKYAYERFEGGDSRVVEDLVAMYLQGHIRMVER